MKFSSIIAFLASATMSAVSVSATEYKCKNEATFTSAPGAPEATDEEIKAGVVLMKKTYKKMGGYDLIDAFYDSYDETEIDEDSVSSLDEEDYEEALAVAGLRGGDLTKWSKKSKWYRSWITYDVLRCNGCTKLQDDDWPYFAEVPFISLTGKNGEALTYELQSENKLWEKKWCKAMRKSGIPAFAGATDCKIHMGHCTDAEGPGLALQINVPKKAE